MNTVARKLWIGVLLAGAAALGVFAAQRLDRAPAAPGVVTLFTAPRPLPTLSLIDQYGNPVTEQWLAGRWNVLFFGFTHCPDVCPMTLGVLRQAAKSNADLAPARQPRMVFVSVDPGRDTPEKIRSYVEFFGEDFAGLTGSADQIAAFAAASGVAYGFSEPDENGNYTVDHTGALFVVNPDAELVGVFTSPHDAVDIAADLRQIVTSGVMN